MMSRTKSTKKAKDVMSPQERAARDAMLASLPPLDDNELEAIFNKAIAKGLTSLDSRELMRKNVREGRFTAEYYKEMLSSRLAKVATTEDPGEEIGQLSDRSTPTVPEEAGTKTAATPQPKHAAIPAGSPPAAGAAEEAHKTEDDATTTTTTSRLPAPPSPPTPAAPTLAKRVSEEALVGLYSAEALSSELSECRTTLGTARSALAATEAEMASKKEAAFQHERAEKAKVASLTGKVDAVDAVLSTVGAFHHQCGTLEKEVLSLHSMEEQRRKDTLVSSGRLQRELAEAEVRLSKQSATLEKTQQTLFQRARQASATEARSEEKLLHLSNQDAAAALKAKLAKEALSKLIAEQSRLMEQSNEEPRRLADIRAREAATEKAVGELKERLLADESAIAEGKRHEADIVQSQALAEAATEARMRSYNVDGNCLRSMAALQDSVLTRELGSTSSNGGALPTDAEEPLRVPTQARLLDESRTLIRKHKGMCLDARKALEAQEAADRQASAEARREREASLKQVRAEWMALESAYEERRRLLGEKALQLEAEKRSTYEAEASLKASAACVLMLEEEAEDAQALHRERAAAAKEAVIAKDAAAAELDALKLTNKMAIATLRNAADSERRVQLEQSQYVESLRQRLKVESQRLAEEQAVEEAASGAKEGAAGPVFFDAQEESGEVATAEAAKEAAKAPADAASGGNNSTGSGVALVTHCTRSVGAWAEALRATRRECAASLEETSQELSISTRRVDLESRRLAERRAALSHEVGVLADYERVVAGKLERAKRSSASTGPTAAAEVASPSSPPMTPLKKPSSGLDAAAPPPTPPTLPPKEPKPPLLSSPSSYDACVKLLDVEPFVDKASPSSVDARLLDEENHARYNPDVNSPGEGTLRSIRQRVMAAF